jgi:hypothetical protein
MQKSYAGCLTFTPPFSADPRLEREINFLLKLATHKKKKGVFFQSTNNFEKF